MSFLRLNSTEDFLITQDIITCDITDEKYLE